MTEIVESKVISEVYHVRFDPFADDRGVFRETFRVEWFPHVDWSRMQSNRSDSQANVLRGLHFHHHQFDYWLNPRGEIRVALCDLRASSGTFKSVEMVQMSAEKMRGLLIPPGVAHGFLTLSEATVTYIVSNYYDGTDEHGVAWDDPELRVPWGVDDALISSRDVHHQCFRDLSAQLRPK